MLYFQNKPEDFQTKFKYKIDYIYNTAQVMNLLLRLSNIESEEYTSKLFNNEELGSFETRHGDRETSLMQGGIWVIAKKEILDKLDETHKYWGSEFSHVATGILESGGSSIMTTNDTFESNVLPSLPISHEKKEKLLKRELKIESYEMSETDIYCYLQEDGLSRAVDAFMEFANTNGFDISGLDDDTLFELISKKHTKKLTSNN